MSAPLVFFVTDGTGRLLRVDDITGRAAELARLNVEGMSEAKIIELMLNVVTSYDGVRAPHGPGRAAPPAPRTVPTGIRSTLPPRPAPAPKKAKRAAPTKRNRADTIRMARAIVNRSPGITRGQLIQELGYGTNPSGTMWRGLVDEAGFRTVKEGSGRGAPVRYFPGDSPNAPDAA